MMRRSTGRRPLAWVFTAAIATSGCLLLLQGGYPGFAQDLGNPKYRLTDRQGPDRREGIKPLDRSGAYLDLVGVFLDAAGIPAAGGPGSPCGSASTSRSESDV